MGLPNLPLVTEMVMTISTQVQIPGFAKTAFKLGSRLVLFQIWSLFLCNHCYSSLTELFPLSCRVPIWWVSLIRTAMLDKRAWWILLNLPKPNNPFRWPVRTWWTLPALSPRYHSAFTKFLS